VSDSDSVSVVVSAWERLIEKVCEPELDSVGDSVSESLGGLESVPENVFVLERVSDFNRRRFLVFDVEKELVP